VSITCSLHVFVSPTWATGTPHTLLGLGTMTLAFGIFLGIGWIMDHLVVEEAAAGESS
jgi:hypothetical protein